MAWCRIYDKTCYHAWRHAPVKTADLRECKLYFLGICDPLINIHELYEFLNQCNGCIFAYASVLYVIEMLQQ